ncbi:hypothetical protein FRC07_009979, partial [Ceratobasidium sp. 392]
ATDQLANLALANPGQTTDEPKHNTPNQHRVPNRANSPDKPQHARFVDVRNGKGYDLPTPVVTEYRGWSCYDGSDENDKGVPWFPPAADLAHLSFDERIEVLRVQHDRCRRYASDSESTRPKHERIMFSTAWKHGERRAELVAQPMQRQDGDGVRQAEFLADERRGWEAQRRPSSMDASRAKNGPPSRPRHVHFVGSPRELPPPGLVRKHTQKYEDYSNTSTRSNSSDTSSNTSFELTDASCSSRTSTASSSSPSKPVVHPPVAPSLAARTEYYREVVAGPPVPREGVTGSWINDMLRAKIHRTFGYKHCINAGVEPEMAALIAVSLDKPMVPEGVPERYGAVKDWETNIAREQERRVDVDYELEKEQALKEERVANRRLRSRHGRQPACSGNDTLSPTIEPSVGRLPGTRPRIFCTPSSPKDPYGEPLHSACMPASPLKRSGAFSAPYRPNKLDLASSRATKAEVRSQAMGTYF